MSLPALAALKKKLITTKQKVIESTKHGIKWIKTGSKLFGANVRVSAQLVKKKANGFELTRKEHALLVRTMTDCFKLVPFSFFVIVPFAELLLPFALKLYPNMLPSTFNEKDVSTTAILKKLKAKQDLAQFFQDIVKERAKAVSTTSEAARTKYEALKEFQEKMLTRKSHEAPLLTLNEVLPFAKLFRDEFKIDNLSLTALQTICRLLGKTPYGLQSHVALQVRHHALRLQREDRQILWDGVEALDHDDLIEACKSRALPFHYVDDATMRKHLKVWLELSQHPDIPYVLLLWSRCITLTHQPLEVVTAQNSGATPTANSSTTSSATPLSLPPNVEAPTKKTPPASATPSTVPVTPQIQPTAASIPPVSPAGQASAPAAAPTSPSNTDEEELLQKKIEEDRSKVAEAEMRIKLLLEQERKISERIKTLQLIAKQGGDVQAANKGNESDLSGDEAGLEENDKNKQPVSAPSTTPESNKTKSVTKE